MRSLYYQILSVMLSALCMSACCSDNTTGPDSASGAARDKQIRLPFVSTNDIAASDTVWYTGGPFHTLIDFDIRDYPGVDSAVFVAYMSSYTPEARLRLQLFNATDSLPIPESELTPIGWKGEYVRSRNIRSVLPNHRVTLGIRTRLAQTGAPAYANFAALFLYRR